MMYGWFDGSAMGWGAMFLGPVMMIVYAVLLVLAIAWALRATGFGWRSNSGDHSPLDVVRDRFARGEIDRAEYEEKLKILSGR
jgi:putative membrane protein